jgi:hypothetical protein
MVQCSKVAHAFTWRCEELMADNNPASNIPVPASSAARQQGAEAIRQGAQAAQQGGQAASEALRRAGDVTAEAAQGSGRAGAEAVQRAGDVASETMRRGAETFAESQRQVIQKAAQQFEEVSRKVAQAAQGTTEDLRTFLTLPHAAKGGLQDLQQGVTGLIEGVVRTNLQATQELLQLANPSAFVELQQRFVREYLDMLMQNTATIVHAIRRTADETLRPLEQQIVQRQANQSQRYQHAAE